MRSSGFFAAVAAIFLLLVGSASAEVRSGSVTDPVDSKLHRNVDGTSYRDQDIQRVTTSYDTAGSISMTFYFLDPVPESTEDQLGATIDCNYVQGDLAEAALSVIADASGSRSGFAIMLINGYEGAIPTTRSLSADHRAITVRASAPILANRAYGCVNFVSLWHMYEDFHCESYGCFETSKATTDETSNFDLDAATAPIPPPAAEAAEVPSATPGPMVNASPADPRCIVARKVLRAKQKQVKKLKAARRAAHKRKLKAALTKQIRAAELRIVSIRITIDTRC